VLKAILTILAFSLSAGSAFAADKLVLMLNWYVYGEHAPFYYGKAKGFYSAQGIDLEIQEGRGSAITTQAVAAKTVDFGYVDVPTMIKAAVKGAPVVAVGVLLQTNPMAVMGFTEKNIRKAEDLKGKTVAVTPGDSPSQIWPLFLKKAGLKESEMHIVSGDAQTKLNAVINGRADVLTGYPMDQGMKIKDATGKDVYAVRWADYGIKMVSSGIITYEEMIKTKPDLVRRFMAASTKAVEEAVKDPEGAVDAILAANPKAGQRATLLEGFKLTTAFYKAPDDPNAPPFRVSENLMAESVDTLVEYGGLDPAAKNKVGSFYTNAFLPAGSGGTR
jgi:NitT/TauT family transport system substrate-binding protein